MVSRCRRFLRWADAALYAVARMSNGRYDKPMHCDLDSSLPDWIIEHPETCAVLERFGLDASCGGKSLEYLCRREGLSPADVLAELARVVAESQTPSSGERR